MRDHVFRYTNITGVGVVWGVAWSWWAIFRIGIERDKCDSTD